MSDLQPNKRVWKSYVWFDDKCYFVSTIERDFDTMHGIIRGPETMVWEYDWDTAKRGEMVEQAKGVGDHQDICRQIIATGKPRLEAPDA